MEKKQPSSRVEKIYVKTSFNIPLGTDHLTCKGGGGGGFRSEFFFPKFNIRLYDKNSESDY